MGFLNIARAPELGRFDGCGRWAVTRLFPRYRMQVLGVLLLVLLSAACGGNSPGPSAPSLTLLSPERVEVDAAATADLVEVEVVLNEYLN